MVPRPQDLIGTNTRLAEKADGVVSQSGRIIGPSHPPCLADDPRNVVRRVRVTASKFDNLNSYKFGILHVPKHGHISPIATCYISRP